MYTGNTPFWGGFSVGVTVYPCVYREHINFLILARNEVGLSLCIQGTLPGIFAHNPHCPVYPCVYREHFYERKKSPLVGGLSLCIQGTPDGKQNTRLSARFIPVYTGNTVFYIKVMICRTVYPCVYREHPNYNLLFIN